MGIVLGDNRYGKAETRLVRVNRDGPRHGLTDLTVSVALAGDLAETHLSGDNAHVLPTDSQKNAVYALARERGIGEIEEFGLALARHFVESQPTIHRARVAIAQHGWERLGEHSFQREGSATRTATVTCDGQRAWVVSGVADLVLMNTTDSEFVGYLRDAYTTLPETTDRILATAVTAQWRHATDGGDWADSFAQTRRVLTATFAGTYSRSLQQTLYAMGRAALEQRPELVEVRMSMPNRHHFLVDLSPFGLENPGEVFFAADRPYGLIEGTVGRDDAPPPGLAWW